MKKRRYFGLMVLVLMLCLSWPSGAAQVPAGNVAQTDVLSVTANAPSGPVTVENLVQQGQTFYQTGKFAEAIAVLQQAIQLYQQQGDSLQQALTLTNLALVYQQQGNWAAANQSIATSLQFLDSLPDHPDRSQVLAQTLNLQGSLQLAQGQSESALQSWEQAAAIYQEGGDRKGEFQSRLNQAQALQAIGLNRRAIALLTDLSQTVGETDDPLLQVTIWRSLGDVLQTAGNLSEARQALTTAQQTASENANAANPALQAAQAAIQLSLANLIRREATTQLSLNGLSPAQALSALNSASQPQSLAEAALQQRQSDIAQQFVQTLEQALPLYQAAIDHSVTATNRMQAALNQLSALIELQRWTRVLSQITILQSELEQLSVEQMTIQQQIQFALELRQVQAAGQLTAEQAAIVPQLLNAAIQSAVALQDIRTQSFALGSLAEWYVQNQNDALAIRPLEQALMLAQSVNAADLSYRWQWQMGRLLKQQGNRTGAIAAYREAVKSLQTLRSDLVAINREVQFSFQTQVEPVYREFVELLLAAPEATPTDNSGNAEGDLMGYAAGYTAVQLVQAREIIEGLQIAELDNFFREACLETRFEIDRVVDQEDLSAAIFYTIVLPDRLEVILKLPHQELLHYRTLLDQAGLEKTVDELLAEVKRPYSSQKFQTLSQQVYQWLIRPAEAQLADHHIKTLVFVLDSALRNVPLSALFDGQQFLVEKYSIALAPGLQITNPKPLYGRKINVLLAGLSEARANFSPLTHVLQEVEEIEADLPSKVLLNQTFTQSNFRQQLDRTAFSIVHIATHGQFSSNLADTFILAWDRPIPVNELSQMLQAEETRAEPIELLVLSACRTATGDRRAALGMAGVAVRAGARSTIASLWNLDDDSGAVLMDQFYQHLVKSPVAKAEALRQAQIALLQNPQYQAPRFWAPYILLGNWL